MKLKYIILLTLFILSLLSIPLAIADSTEARCDIYPKGEDHSDVSIPCRFTQRQGYIYIDRSDNISHELTPQEDAVGNFKDAQGNNVYRQSGLGELGLIFRFKDESIYLYWDTAGLPESSSNHAYDKIFDLLGISFHVSCPNDSSLSTLTIKPSGLKIDNSTITQEIDGIVIGAEVADINSDGSPEIYIYTQSAGSGRYGNVIAYSANHKKSLSSIYLPPLSDDKKNSKGYMGHDEFAVVETSFVRRFPLYKKGDTNSQATGGTRQLQYKLVMGEASWQLKLF